MTITPKPGQEEFIRAEIEGGHLRSPDEVLDHALAALKETEHDHATEESSAIPAGVSARWRRVEPGKAEGPRLPH